MDNKPFFLMTTTNVCLFDSMKAEIVSAFGLDAKVEWLLLHEGEDISDAYAVSLPAPEEFPHYLRAAKDFAREHKQEAFYFIDTERTLTAFNEREGKYEPEYGFTLKNVPMDVAQKQHEYFVHRGGDTTTYWVIY